MKLSFLTCIAEIVWLWCLKVCTLKNEFGQHLVSAISLDLNYVYLFPCLLLSLRSGLNIVDVATMFCDNLVTFFFKVDTQGFELVHSPSSGLFQNISDFLLYVLRKSKHYITGNVKFYILKYFIELILLIINAFFFLCVCIFYIHLQFVWVMFRLYIWAW